MSVHTLAARAIAPIVLAIICGIYEFITRGASSDFCLYTYVPVLGGVTATVGLMAYYSRVVTLGLLRIRSQVSSRHLPYR
jgi:hypothetical protein